jgi:hypothetical protein
VLIGWIVLLIVVGLLARVGARFRRGTARGWLRVYRNPEYPAFVRNLIVIWPLALAFLGLLALGAIPLLLGSGSRSALPASVRAGIGYSALGLFCALGGLVLVLATRLPKRFRPGWLVDDDRRSGWRQPALEFVDRIVLVFGLFLVALGILTIAYAITQALAASG